MKVYTKSIHTIIFVFISETYLVLHFFYYYKKGVFTNIRVLNELKYDSTKKWNRSFITIIN